MTEAHVIEPKANRKRRPVDRRWLALLLVCAAQLMIVLEGTLVNVALPPTQGSLALPEPALRVCAAELMIVLDGAIVNVALPAIQGSLAFSETALSWVVNAYLLAFGGFLLLGGRAGDLFGRRRVFAAGLALFTLASLLCGLAGSQGVLVVARASPGLGGGLLAPAALSIIITTFKDPKSRARAMGIWAFVVSGGASIGVLLGGVLTQTLGWPWIFFVNIPVGLVAIALCRPLLDPDPTPEERGVGERGGCFDLPGAFLVTASLVVA